MGFTSTGKDAALRQNLDTGRWDLDWDATNNIKMSDDESHAVLSLLLEYKGLWFADATGQRASTLYLIRQDKKTTAGDIEAASRQALQVLVDSKRISIVSLTAVRSRPGRFTLTIYWSVPSGATPSLRISLTY